MTDVAEVNVVWEIDAMRAALGLLLNLLRIGFSLLRVASNYFGFNFIGILAVFTVLLTSDSACFFRVRSYLFRIYLHCLFASGHPQLLRITG
jgi:hypothetical protein